MASGECGHGRWRKLLYLRQERFPDNYVDSSFLEELQKNVNVRTYGYWELVTEMSSLLFHVNSVMIFICIFIYVYTDMMSLSLLVLFEYGSAIAGLFLWSCIFESPDPSKSTTLFFQHYKGQALKSGFLFFFILFGLSPILKTLTEDTSCDTIWAFSAYLFAVNVAFHDYSHTLKDSNYIKFSGTMSINAAIFGSVLLASRLTSVEQVFGLVSCAVIFFALVPSIHRNVQKSLSSLHVLFIVHIISLTTFVLFWSIYIPVAILFGVFVLGTTFVCPLLYLGLQKYKNEIKGPWDEAKLVFSPKNVCTKEKGQ